MTLSIDIGGTFTDFVLIDKGNIKHFKCPSNPINPENAIKEGLKDKDFEGECYHGTTVATNAFLEGKGVKTAFITNKGFEDILFIARQDRPELYNLHVKKPEPPIKREHCYGIQGRINSKGEVIEDLDLGQIKDVARVLKINGLSASICLLHSYINPKHELEVGKILDGFDVNYSLSSQVSREFREYERGLTTVLDAYLSPLLKNYFDSIEKIIGKEPWIMKSSGGLEKASDIDPVDTLFSGPAGGVAGGQHVSKLANISNLVTFDMGGTSADMATIIGGQISWKDEGMIDRFPIQSKMVDIVTVGSGGGSIARCDEGGALRVGPQSAGAYPGPICYGRDGEKPTVTDTLLCMGYIDPDYFLGGKMELNENKARSALEFLADELKMDFDETLLGIYKIANTKMARTMKKITVERGLDPEKFTILAFGGAGPLHAAYLAEEMDISHVIVPPMPGVFSALGMATGDIVKDYSRTLITPLSNRERIDRVIEVMNMESVGGEKQILLGLRYKGQSYHINIPYTEDIEESFHREHEKKYGYSNTDAELEVVRVHIEIRKERDFYYSSPKEEDIKSSNKRVCLFPKGKEKADVYYREGFVPENKKKGPCIIEDRDSTLLVPPKWFFTVDKNKIVHMEKIE